MSISKKLAALLTACALALLGALPLAGCSDYGAAVFSSSSGISAGSGAGQQQGSSGSELATQGDSYAYTFRSNKQLADHYDKHGREMGYASPGEYERAASRVATNPAALHKLQAEDGDDVYYLVTSNDFVVVSPDGYIRTYFRPDSGKSYYDRQ